MPNIRINLLSDLHLECFRADPEALDYRSLHANPEDTDLYVLAGDIDDTGLTALSFLSYMNSLGKPVLYLLGNHEYYYCDGFGTLADRYRAAFNEQPGKYHNVKLLDDSGRDLHGHYVDLLGVRFVGATLWTDFNLLLKKPAASVQEKAEVLTNAKASMRDYMRIGKQVDVAMPLQTGTISVARLEPQDILTANARGRSNIYRTILASSLPTVVVTHHAPLMQSMAQAAHRARQILTEQPDNQQAQRILRTEKHHAHLYCNDLTELLCQLALQRKTPLAWLHGHLHATLDYNDAGVRVCCNAMGYYPHLNTDFVPSKIVHLSC
ncbi:metallophosphoesterase [Rheinheimera sp. F8]|uniref:metallophosphoesterase n=1 Tax=Rheinheimera sp. F8 TaxID=1763998 RepID=UPI000A8078DC|nr:metallophosphoesterase [Rheinheimera sp. F8]